MKEKISKFLTVGEYKKIKKAIICSLMIIFTVFWYINCDDKESSLYIDANIFSLIICASGILLTMMDVPVSKISNPLERIKKAFKNIFINLAEVIYVLGMFLFRVAKILYTIAIASFPLGIIIRFFTKSNIFPFYNVALSNVVICQITVISFIIILLSLWLERYSNKTEDKEEVK